MEMQAYEFKVEFQCPCDGCKVKVKKQLGKIEGVHKVTIDANKGEIHVTGDFDHERLVRMLQRNGISVLCQIQKAGDMKYPHSIKPKNTKFHQGSDRTEKWSPFVSSDGLDGHLGFNFEDKEMSFELNHGYDYPSHKSGPKSRVNGPLHESSVKKHPTRPTGKKGREQVKEANTRGTISKKSNGAIDFPLEMEGMGGKRGGDGKCKTDRKGKKGKKEKSKGWGMCFGGKRKSGDKPTKNDKYLEIEAKPIKDHYSAVKGHYSNMGNPQMVQRWPVSAAPLQMPLAMPSPVPTQMCGGYYQAMGQHSLYNPPPTFPTPLPPMSGKYHLGNGQYNPYAQNLAMSQQQRFVDGNLYHPMTHARPEYNASSPQITESFVHMFSDENAESCSIM